MGIFGKKRVLDITYAKGITFAVLRLKAIVKIQLKEFQTRLKDKAIDLKVGGSVVNALAKAAYKPESGAREVRRILAKSVEHPLVEALINGKVKDGQTIAAKYDTKKAACTFEAHN